MQLTAPGYYLRKYGINLSYDDNTIAIVKMLSKVYDKL